MNSTLNRSISWRSIICVFALALALTTIVGGSALAQDDKKALPNIVLVHGAWADGSSWSPIIERLQAAGYNVTAPQFAETSLEDDVARLRRVLVRQKGPTLLVGHSYGGEIITALGKDAPNVIGLVYIAAFGLDEGESVGGLLAQGAPTPALAHLDIDAGGFVWLPEDDFVNHFASGVDPVKAKILFAAQQPSSASILETKMTEPSWKNLPSWYMVATKDEVIPPDAQRFFAKRMGATTTEVESGHLPMLTLSDDVAKFVETAAQALTTK